MAARNRGNSKNKLGWGVDPVFCRGLSVSEVSGLRRPEGAPGEFRSERYARRLRPAACGGILASVALHVLVFVLWPGAQLSVERPFTGRATSRDIQVVNLVTPPAAEVEQARSAPKQVGSGTLVARVDWPNPSVRESATSSVGLDLALADAAVVSRTLLLSRGDGSAHDAREETPAGSGAGALDGDGHYTAPRVRSILPAWKPPRSVYGVAVLVRVRTDAEGNATGPVELDPPTRDADTNREIEYRVRQLEYEPARIDGVAVAAWAEITFVFCYNGITATNPPSPIHGQAEPCSRGTIEEAASGP